MLNIKITKERKSIAEDSKYYIDINNGEIISCLNCSYQEITKLENFIFKYLVNEIWLKLIKRVPTEKELNDIKGKIYLFLKKDKNIFLSITNIEESDTVEDIYNNIKTNINWIKELIEEIINDKPVIKLEYEGVIKIYEK